MQKSFGNVIADTNSKAVPTQFCGADFGVRNVARLFQNGVLTKPQNTFRFMRKFGTIPTEKTKKTMSIHTTNTKTMT